MESPSRHSATVGLTNGNSNSNSCEAVNLINSNVAMIGLRPLATNTSQPPPPLPQPPSVPIPLPSSGKL